MTETSTFPSVAQPDEGMGIMPPDAGTDESSGGSDRRRLIMIIGAVVGVLVLAGAAFMLTHKGSSSSPSSGAVPKGVFHGAPKTTSSKTVVVRKSHTTKPKTLPKVQHNQQVVNPFKPLVILPVTTSGSAASSTTVAASNSTSTSTSSSTGSSTTSTPTTPTTPPSSGKTTTKGNGKTSSQPQWIQLVSVQGHMANFKVGYAHHKFRLYSVQEPHASATAGTVFDKEFALIGIVNGGATVQIGDGTPFLLTPGIARVV